MGWRDMHCTQKRLEEWKKKHHPSESKREVEASIGSGGPQEPAAILDWLLRSAWMPGNCAVSNASLVRKKKSKPPLSLLLTKCCNQDFKNFQKLCRSILFYYSSFSLLVMPLCIWPKNRDTKLILIFQNLLQECVKKKDKSRNLAQLVTQEVREHWAQRIPKSKTYGKQSGSETLKNEKVPNMTLKTGRKKKQEGICWLNTIVGKLTRARWN